MLINTTSGTVNVLRATFEIHHGMQNLHHLQNSVMKILTKYI